MARYEFKSVFSDEIQNYADSKQAAGYSGSNAKSELSAFDRFCVSQGKNTPTFTKDDAALWIEQRPNESHTTHYSRVNSSKHFLKYLSLKGYDVYVIRDVKFKKTDFQPHIYTPDETERYFTAVDHYSNTHNKKLAIQYPVLFRIIYCCGTRINETLGIHKNDVDLEHGILRLNETKNNKQRYVVLPEDLRLLLVEYADKCFYQLNDGDYIFTNTRGGRLDDKSVYEDHRKFLHRAGIPYLGGGNGPRIHDWRHTMAVYSFKQLTDSGMDMYVALPILSAYLGHKTIFATEKYVRLTMQLFPYIEEKFRKKVDEIFNIAGKEGETDEID